MTEPVPETDSRVRLSFPKGEHPDVLVPPGELTIGSADGNAVVLKSDGIKPQHASILVDPRGFTLIVRNNDAFTHVNARPIRERAILRLGDVISLQSVNLVLKPDRDEAIRPPPPAALVDVDPRDGAAKDDPARQGPPRVVLRAVSGPYFGRAIPISGKVTLGNGADCDVVLDEADLGAKHAEIRVAGGSISLRDLGAKGSQVNGVQVKDAQLFSGDQVAFGNSRFLVEAPGMPTRKDVPTVQGVVIQAPAPSAQAPAAAENRGNPQVTQTMRAIRIDQPPPPGVTPAPTPTAAPTPNPTPAPVAMQPSEPAAEQAYNPWILIAIGAMIAVGITLLLMARAG